MSNFLRPSKKSLKNAQHFAFFDAFLTALRRADFSATKVTNLITQLEEAFQDEDRWYVIARRSDLVAQRDAADKVRADKYSRLHKLVRLWAGSEIEPADAAAKRLKRIFDLYHVNTSAQIDEETGQMENLITDISTDAMQADLATIRGTELFQQMTEAHEQVKSIRLEQGVEVSEKVRGALAAARRLCDSLYDQLTYLLEAFALTADDAQPYEAFIKSWNGTLKLYQDMINRKSGTSTTTNSGKGGSTADGGGQTTEPGTSTDEPGTSPDDPENPGTTDPDEPGTGGGTSDPDPAPNPDPSTGGGSDNGDDDGLDKN